jgi:hypothetical protein
LAESEENVVKPEFPSIVESDLGSPKTELVISSYPIRYEEKDIPYPKEE